METFMLNNKMKNFHIQVDNYGYLTSATPELQKVDSKLKKLRRCSLSFVLPFDNIPLSTNVRENRKSAFIMKDIFFACNCKKKDGTRSLILNGKDLYSRIGRRFRNWDVPHLWIFLTKNSNITKLNLASNEIDSAGFITLINYTIKHQHIVDIDVRNNDIGSDGIRHMNKKAEKLNLRVLRLSGNKIGVLSSKRVAQSLIKNTSIEHLDVAQIDQDEASLVYFTTVLRSDQSHFNQTLKVLDLSRPIPQCNYSKFNSLHIARAIGFMLQHSVSLEELHIQKFNFSCHDIEEMLEIAKHNKILRVLDLCCNNIGDYGTKMLSRWIRNRSSFQSLLLAHNIIGNHGIRALSRSIPFSKLLMLDVSHNRFDDESGVELFYTLKKCPLMEQVRISGNNIGHPVAKIVARMLLSDVIKQENIDVKPYKINETYYFAYYQPKELK